MASVCLDPRVFGGFPVGQRLAGFIPPLVQRVAALLSAGIDLLGDFLLLVGQGFADAVQIGLGLRHLVGHGPDGLAAGGVVTSGTKASISCRMRARNGSMAFSVVKTESADSFGMVTRGPVSAGGVAMFMAVCLPSASRSGCGC
jgi:hypothetical protein